MGTGSAAHCYTLPRHDLVVGNSVLGRGRITMEGQILHEILGSEHGKRDKTSEAEKRGLLG